VDQLDSAAATYRRAAAVLPAVADWILLKAAAVTADSAARVSIYERINLSLAKARTGWTDAAAEERAGNLQVDDISSSQDDVTIWALGSIIDWEDDGRTTPDPIAAFTRVATHLRQKPAAGTVAEAVEASAFSSLAEEEAKRDFRERSERSEQPRERLVVGADGDEDQSTAPAYSARRKRSATAGHWTKKRLASG